MRLYLVAILIVGILVAAAVGALVFNHHLSQDTTVTLIFPSGFRGDAEIGMDDSNGTPVSFFEKELKIVFPSNGLATAQCNFNDRGRYVLQCYWANGNPIRIGVLKLKHSFPSSEIAVWPLLTAGDRKHKMQFFVGTTDEAYKRYGDTATEFEGQTN